MASLCPALSAAVEAERSLQLEILINGDKSGLIGTFVQRPDGTVAARRSELAESGVKVPGTGQPDEIIVVNEWLGNKFHYDEPAQTISFDLTDAQRIARAFDALGSAPHVPVTTGWGSVLNYTLFGSETSGLSSRQTTFNGGSASLDARMFSPYGTLSQTGIVGTTTTRDMTVLRLESALSYSDPASLITYRAGDTAPSPMTTSRRNLRR
jgi:outer membrane usher protein